MCIRNRGADGDLLGAHLAPCAVSLLYRGLFRGQVEQATDSVTSAIQRFGFDYLGQREQYHHHCRFGPVADQHGTRDRNRHEGVNVEITVLERNPPLLVGGEATREAVSYTHLDVYKRQVRAARRWRSCCCP